MNYTKDQTEYMIERYRTNPSRDTVEELADEFSKSVKSVIGKLSREGVYRREVYKTKTGENPVTKVEIVGKWWRVWARSLGEKVTESSTESDVVAIIRTFWWLLHVVTCFFIIVHNGRNLEWFM